MPKISYPVTSAYSETFQYSWCIGRYNDRMIPDDGTDVSFTLTPEYHHRADKLAYDRYGDAGYWWVFESRNPSVLIDSLWGFKEGLTINIPSKSNVEKARAVAK